MDKYFNITDESIVGAICMCAGFGNLIGAPVAGKLSDAKVARYLEKRKGLRIPEDRLRVCIFGAMVALPLSALLFGVALNVLEGPIAIATICLCLMMVGMGVDLCFGPGVAYIAESVEENRVGALAANSSTRVAALALLSSSILPFVKTVGVLWVTVCLAALGLVSGSILLTLIHLGERDAKRKQLA